MSLLAQSGFGPGQKIQKGLYEDIIHGVILSPRDERKDRIEQVMSDTRNSYPNAVLMFDPQFYAANLNNPRDGHLSEYDYYSNNNNLGRAHFSGTLIQKYVRECLDYQHKTLGMNANYLVSPSVLFDSFHDSWSQIALNMAVESVEYHSKLESPKPLLITLIISETAFQSINAIEEFLDVITEIDVKGFYIIIRRNSTSLQNAMDSSLFSRFMYFCHVLATINEYDVIVGYSDWQSFLLEAVGVKYTATGWYQNLRQFTLARFQPSPGGQRPRKRYSSKTLLDCLLILPNLQDLYELKLLPHALSGSIHDIILKNGPVSNETNWTDEISCLAHWYSLNALSNYLGSLPSQSDRILGASRIIQDSLELYTQLITQGANLGSSSEPYHLREWQNSLQEFRLLAGI